nr:immunoglobulin heavy chain junction region [Mus musculus]NSM04212.1 immunoglobulin heavy chain junction region [Mus musculus]NSM04397.1 immunoglobulin heavy chain junction region [Mus musculus]NSM04653.1 immunoglobulin heavy chain junction region [Mus musculus]NSM04785.1 immunoglobulin heavy chain junction region [Mus musculus]
CTTGGYGNYVNALDYW